MNPEELEKQLTKFEEINKKSKEYESLVGKFIDHEEDFDTDTLKLLFQDADALVEMEKEMAEKSPSSNQEKEESLQPIAEVVKEIKQANPKIVETTQANDQS